MLTRFRPRGSRAERSGESRPPAAPAARSAARQVAGPLVAPPRPGRPVHDPEPARPFVDDGLSGLVDAAYRRFVGRAPTRAERLLDVAELQARPGVAGLLSALFESEPPPPGRRGPGG